MRSPYENRHPGEGAEGRLLDPAGPGLCAECSNPNYGPGNICGACRIPGVDDPECGQNSRADGSGVRCHYPDGHVGPHAWSPTDPDDGGPRWGDLFPDPPRRKR